MMISSFNIRPAAISEVPELEALIERSARDLSRGFYSEAQIEAAINEIFGVDSELVADGTYLVALASDQPDGVLGCGGWSRRATLFGGDRFADRVSGLLDPERDPAKIRAFFVAPEAARIGVASAILAACEAAAQEAGFNQTELMATLPGEPFYLARSYSRLEFATVDCGGTDVNFVRMIKDLPKLSLYDPQDS